MNKLNVGLICLVMVMGALSGCAKKSDNDDEHSSAGDLDESAIYDSVLADTGFRVMGTLTGTGTALTAGAAGSAASASGVDNASPDDSAGAVDKADFLIDAKEGDATRVQGSLRSMTTGKDAGSDADFQGGVANNIQVFGTTGLGPSEFPETKAYLAVFGMSRLRINNQSVEASQPTMVFVTKGVRGDDGALATAVDEDDLELHVLFPGNTDGGAAIAGVPDGFLYYYFENVKVKQLTPDEKSAVGAKLVPPEKANVLPVVVAQVKLANGSVVSTATIEGTTPLNVTFDASNSTDDGTIEAFSWDVQQYNSTGFLEPAGNQSKVSGSVVNFSFTSPGLKQISLRVIDDRGGIANVTQFFFVDYHKVFAFSFADSQIPPAGAGQACEKQINCQEHKLTVGFGATKLVVGPADGDGTCQSPSIRVLDPTGTSQGSGAGPIEVTGADKVKVGLWTIEHFCTALANYEYELPATVFFTPQAAPAA